MTTHAEIQLASFLATGKPQSTRSGFRQNQRKAERLLRKGKLDEARELIDHIQSDIDRNLLEELYFRALEADYQAARGDADREYQHLQRVLDFSRYDFNKHRILDNLYYLPYLFRAYEYEVSRMRVADAFATARWMQSIDPDNKAVKQVQAHAGSLQEKLAGNGYQIQGLINAPLYADGAGTWSAALMRKEIALEIPSGEAEWVVLNCENGRKQLDYKPGVAWIIPELWENCSLDVRGAAGTALKVTEYPAGTLLAAGD